MMYRNDLGKTHDLPENLAAILANLAELTKRSANFEELREILPLLSDLKKTQNHNREMNSILGVMEKALSEVKSNYGATSRAVSTCANTLDRAASQITPEINKLQDSLKKLEGEYASLQAKLKEKISFEYELAEQQIKQARDNNLRKIKDFISRQQAQLCLGSSIRSDKYKLALLRRRIEQNPLFQRQYKQCQILFGEVTCLKVHSLRTTNNRKINSREDQAAAQTDFYDEINHFIQQSQKHFQREYPFVVSKLTQFEQEVDLNPYEQGIFHQCYAWGTRLRVSLEAAIIKVSVALRQTLDISEKQAQAEPWEQTLERWEGMRLTLGTLLQ